MRKLILVLSFVLTNAMVSGQSLEIDFVVRPALTSLRGNPIVKNNLDPVINLSGGLGINYYLSRKAILSIAVLYDKKGGSDELHFSMRNDLNEIIDRGSVKHKSVFEYITIPIQVGHRFGQQIKYQFGIGLYTGFLLSQKSTSAITGGRTETKNETKDFKKVDSGLSVSFHVFIPIKDKLSFKAGIDDHLGLINTSDVGLVNDGAIRHNSLGLSFGVNFKMN